MLGLLFLLATSSGVIAAPGSQFPLQATLATRPHRKLTGRFLHLTDMHPDIHYMYEASESTSCHRKKPAKEKERAGYYGLPFSDCDSPLKLTDLTLDALSKQWASEIDFVIWTGDNARHDSDNKVPRTNTEIFSTNRMIAKRMEEIFVHKGIPVIPSLGNNDVFPHNIMLPGPNAITNEFSSIWKSFIPFESYQVFQRGAYYSAQVIPDAVAAISLNTMYFYDSNKAVDGCLYTAPTDPGNLQLDWLEVQLRIYRSKGMHVWVTGHVPPSPGNYWPECYTRYVELSLRFQDTILGHLFGHMNSDHFFFLEADDLHIITDEYRPSARIDLFDALMRDFEELPKAARKIDFDEWSVVNVAGSVVPNPYTSSFRIFSYNITGAPDGVHLDVASAGKKKKKKGGKRKHGHRRGNHGEKDAECKKPPHKNTWKCHLSRDGWNSDEESPSRTNMLWSPTGYAQFYLPDLEVANKTHPPYYKLEYLTHQLEALHPQVLPATASDAEKFIYPVPPKQLPKSLRHGNATKSKYAPYEMPDLTVSSWIRLAESIAKDNKKGKRLRKVFKHLMYFGQENEG